MSVDVKPFTVKRLDQMVEESSTNVPVSYVVTRQYPQLYFVKETGSYFSHERHNNAILLLVPQTTSIRLLE